MGLAFLLSILLGLAFLYLLRQFVFPQSLIAPLPPGPKPKPIIGNLGDLPSPGQQDWVHWLKFRDLYGPISSITVFGQTIVILNDSRIAFDLLDKRSNIYSSRPRMVFAGEMVGWEHILAMQTYSDLFRAYRKAMHRVLGTKNAIAQFNSLQHVEVRRFLLRVLRKPEDLVQHIRTKAGAIILKIAYGYNIESHGRDPLIALANDSLEKFSIAGTPGTWMVDTIPLLKYVPSWFPGAGFKRTSAAWRKTLFATIEKPYKLTRQQINQGIHPPSYLASLLEEYPEQLNPEEEQVAKWTAASLYTGGADTTVSTLSCFFLAMALYPEVQTKAQRELDSVLGPNKLPTFEDRDRLPYIEAVVKEALRWHPVGPMGIPHMCTEDDVYEGHLIPKGAIIMPNIWGFTHDPKVYPSPMLFKPERFLEVDGHIPELDPHDLTFGFGRRACPGRLLADCTVFLSIAQSLTVFKFRNDGDACANFLPGVISHPAPYKLNIIPRSEAHEALIRSVEIEHLWEKSHAKDIDNIVC